MMATKDGVANGSQLGSSTTCTVGKLLWSCDLLFMIRDHMWSGLYDKWFYNLACMICDYVIWHAC